MSTASNQKGNQVKARSAAKKRSAPKEKTQHADQQPQPKKPRKARQSTANKAATSKEQEPAVPENQAEPTSKRRRKQTPSGEQGLKESKEHSKGAKVNADKEDAVSHKPEPKRKQTPEQKARNSRKSTAYAKAYREALPIHGEVEARTRAKQVFWAALTYWCCLISFPVCICGMCGCMSS